MELKSLGWKFLNKETFGDGNYKIRIQIALQLQLQNFLCLTDKNIRSLVCNVSMYHECYCGSSGVMSACNYDVYVYFNMYNLFYIILS